MSQPQETDSPARTSFAAAMWFSVPSRSSGPQRPQLESFWNQPRTSCSDGAGSAEVNALVLLRGDLGQPSRITRGAADVHHVSGPVAALDVRVVTGEPAAR